MLLNDTSNLRKRYRLKTDKYHETNNMSKKHLNNTAKLVIIKYCTSLLVIW